MHGLLRHNILWTALLSLSLLTATHCPTAYSSTFKERDLWRLLRQKRHSLGLMKSGGHKHDPYLKVMEYLGTLSPDQLSQALVATDKEGTKTIAHKAFANRYYSSLAILDSYRAVPLEVTVLGLELIQSGRTSELAESDQKALNTWLASALSRNAKLAKETLAGFVLADDTSPTIGELERSLWESLLMSDAIKAREVGRWSHTLAQKGDLSRLEILATHPFFDPQVIDSSGVTLAIQAYLHKQWEVVEWLIKKGFVDEDDRVDGGGSLIAALRYEKLKEIYVKSAAKTGADPHKRADLELATALDVDRMARKEEVESRSFRKANVLYQGLSDSCHSCRDLVLSCYGDSQLGISDSPESEWIHMGLCDYDSDEDSELDEGEVTDHDERDRFGLTSSCGHTHCPDCLKVYIENEAETGKTIECPQYGCCYPFTLGELEGFLSAEQIDEYADSLAQEEMLTHAGYGHCQTPNCDFSYDDHSHPDRCLDCHKVIPCSLCGGPHPESECSAQDQGLAMSGTRCGIKACPKCKRLIERGKGCLHMTCPCRYEFCWVCRGPWPGTSTTSKSCPSPCPRRGFYDVRTKSGERIRV